MGCRHQALKFLKAVPVRRRGLAGEPLLPIRIRGADLHLLSEWASNALSINSFAITNGQSSVSWPVWATSSFSEQKSNSLDVVNVVRSRFVVGAVAVSGCS